MNELVLRTEPSPGVHLVTLNRPERLNALTAELVDALYHELGGLAQDPTARVVILTGSGRGFCSGFDLGGYGDPPGPEGASKMMRDYASQRHIAGLIPAIKSLPVPVIAAVNGPATGGGLALALACDVRLASTTARFSAAFIRLGQSGCDIGVSWLLPRAVGTSSAFSMMLTGRLVDAEEALRMGLVTELRQGQDLIPAAVEFASLISRNSPFAVRMTKEVMWAQLEVGSLSAGIELENRTQTLAATTADHLEALAAFREKRQAVFRNA